MEQKWNINNGKIMDLKNGKKMEKKLKNSNTLKHQLVI